MFQIKTITLTSRAETPITPLEALNNCLALAEKSAIDECVSEVRNWPLKPQMLETVWFLGIHILSHYCALLNHPTILNREPHKSTQSLHLRFHHTSHACGYLALSSGGQNAMSGDPSSRLSQPRSSYLFNGRNYWYSHHSPCSHYLRSWGNWKWVLWRCFSNMADSAHAWHFKIEAPSTRLSLHR